MHHPSPLRLNRYSPNPSRGRPARILRDLGHRPPATLKTSRWRSRTRSACLRRAFGRQAELRFGVSSKTPNRSWPACACRTQTGIYPGLDNAVPLPNATPRGDAACRGVIRLRRMTCPERPITAICTGFKSGFTSDRSQLPAPAFASPPRCHRLARWSFTIPGYPRLPSKSLRCHHLHRQRAEPGHPGRSAGNR